MIVVADTSPLNDLALIGQAELLFHLFERVIVPRAVAQELTATGTPSAARQLIEQAPPWLLIRQASTIDPTLPRLGAGEREAISLAQELRADLLLCDDAEARRVAMARSVRVAGTLGVLELGAVRNLVDLSQCVSELRRTSMRLPDDLVTRMLHDDAERRRP